MRINKISSNLLTKVSQLSFLFIFLLFATSCQEEEMNNGKMKGKAMDKMDNGKSLPPGDMSIAAIAIENDFNELVAALSYVDSELDAGLVDLFLNGTDQYTVFAPTDAAFQDLYAAAGVSAITDLPAELVLNVLLYHVTEGRRAANSVVPKKNPRTIETLLEDATFAVTSVPSIDAVGNEAGFVATNISASNGIIHVIDAVLLPIEL